MEVPGEPGKVHEGGWRENGVERVGLKLFFEKVDDFVINIPQLFR